MAQYATDFSEYASTAAPSDWTMQFGTGTWTVEEVAGATGGKCLVRSGDSAQDFLSWDDIDADANRDDVEMLARVRFPASATTQELRLAARGSDTSGQTVYHMGLRNEQAIISKYVGGGFTPLYAGGVTASDDTWYWLRGRVNGSTLQVRRWADGDAEPGTWENEVTDTSITTAGWVGIGCNRDGPVQLDFFSVGTGGDAALSEVPGRTATAGEASDVPGGTITFTLSTFDGTPSGVTINGVSASFTGNSTSIDVTLPALSTFVSGGTHAATRWNTDIDVVITEAGGSATASIQIAPPDTDGPTYWFGAITTASGDTVLPAGSATDDDGFYEVLSGTTVTVNTGTGSTSAASSTWSVAGRYYDVSASSWSTINPESFDTSGLSIPIAMHYYRQMAR